MQNMAAPGAIARTPADTYRVQILAQAGLIHASAAQSLMGSVAPLGPSPSHMRHIDMGREHLADGCRLLAGISTAFESTSPDDIDEYREISLQIDSHENHLNWLIDELGRIEDAGHAEDVADASRIAHNNLLRLDALLHARRSRTRFEDVSIWDFTEPIEERPATAHTGRHGGSRRARPPAGPIAPGIIIPDVIAVERPGFRNRLIPEQWNSIDSLDGYWERLRHVGGKLLPHYTVVAPTGWGKSWAMAGVIELGITRGRLDFSDDGSQVLIFDHRTDITAQNFRRIRDCLAPVFNARYGRPPRITLYAGNEADCTGDIVIVSLPKAGRVEALPDFLKRLSDAGKKVGLIHVDEVHHSEGDLWRKAIGEAVSYARTKVHRPFVVGWTATLPDDMRPSRVIAYEMTAREGMSRGIIPTVHLQPVRTGVSIQNVRMHAGDFSERDLSRTVRNYARDRRTMEVIDFTGARDPKHVLERMSVVGVDVAHARELARYMQMYFSDPGRPRQFRTKGGRELPWLGVHQMYVLDEGASPEEVRSVLDAYASREEYPIPQFARVEASKMGDASDLRYGTLGDSPRRRIGMIAAVVSGKTRPESWRLIWDAWERGIIPVVFSNKKLEEGVDAKHVLEYVRGRPSLDPIVTEQGFGRFLRYMDDEIDRNTGELKMVRRRVAYDLVDDSSRPIVYLGEVLGFTGQDCRTWEGRIVNLQTGAVTDDQIGGFHDLIERKEDGTPALRKPPDIPIYPTKIVHGAREHRLRTDEENLSPFCLALRRTWAVRFRSNIAAMSLWLGCREEELVSYLNGELPGTERQTQRFATLVGMKRHNLDAEWYISQLKVQDDIGKATEVLHGVLIGAYVYLGQTNIAGPWSGGNSISGFWYEDLAQHFFRRTIGPKQTLAACREIAAGLLAAKAAGLDGVDEHWRSYSDGVRALMDEGVSISRSELPHRWQPVDEATPVGAFKDFIREHLIRFGGIIPYELMSTEGSSDIRTITNFIESDTFDNTTSIAGKYRPLLSQLHNILDLSQEDSEKYWQLASAALRDVNGYPPLDSIEDKDLRELLNILWFEGFIKNCAGVIKCDPKISFARAPKQWPIRSFMSDARMPHHAALGRIGNVWEQAIEVVGVPEKYHRRYWHLVSKLTRRAWGLEPIGDISASHLRPLVGMLWDRTVRKHGGVIPFSVLPENSPLRHLIRHGAMPTVRTLGKYSGNIWLEAIEALGIEPKHTDTFWQLAVDAYSSSVGYTPLDRVENADKRALMYLYRKHLLKNCRGIIRSNGSKGPGAAASTWFVLSLMQDGRSIAVDTLTRTKGNPWLAAAEVFSIPDEDMAEYWSYISSFLRFELSYRVFAASDGGDAAKLGMLIWESLARSTGGGIRVSDINVGLGHAPHQWPVRLLIEKLRMPPHRAGMKAKGNVWRQAIAVAGIEDRDLGTYWKLVSRTTRSELGLPPTRDIKPRETAALAEFLWRQFIMCDGGIKIVGKKAKPGIIPGAGSLRKLCEHGQIPSIRSVGGYVGNIWKDAVIALKMDSDSEKKFWEILSPAIRAAWGLPAFDDITDVPLRQLGQFLWKKSLRMSNGWLRLGKIGSEQAHERWPLRHIFERGIKPGKKATCKADMWKEGEIVFGLSGDDLAEYRRLVAAYEGK